MYALHTCMYIHTYITYMQHCMRCMSIVYLQLIYAWIEMILQNKSANQQIPCHSDRFNLLVTYLTATAAPKFLCDPQIIVPSLVFSLCQLIVFKIVCKIKRNSLHRHGILKNKSLLFIVHYWIIYFECMYIMFLLQHSTTLRFRFITTT